MSRRKKWLSWVVIVISMLISSIAVVEAADVGSIKWPSHMLTQEGGSFSIVSSGVAQPLEAGLRQIGIDTNISYMLMDKSGNNYYYARYGEGTLLYGFGPKKDGWNPINAPIGYRYTVSMIQDYDAYVKDYSDMFKVVVPFREVRKQVYIGEMIVNTWYKQMEYPMYMQIALLADGTGAPKVRYIMTHVKDESLRKQLNYLL